MTDPESNSDGDENNETASCEYCDLTELETLTRDGEWDDDAFRDAGEATFGGR